MYGVRAEIDAVFQNGERDVACDWAPSPGAIGIKRRNSNNSVFTRNDGLVPTFRSPHRRTLDFIVCPRHGLWLDSLSQL